MLRVVSDTARRDLAPYRATAAPVEFGEGFYSEERDGVHLFRWMRLEGELRLEPSPENRFLEIWVFSSFRNLSQELTVTGSDRQERVVMAHGWSRLSVPITAGTPRIGLRANKLFPRSYYPDDTRSLAIRVRSGAYVHGDPSRHRLIRSQHENRIHNWREMLAGKAVLESSPPTLGIDMYGVCNVKPPCVYCEWDTSKEMEGDNVDAPFSRETLESWGQTFANSSTLINCSIGEPFMMKNLDELFDVYGDEGKALEMTTNGQILTDRNIEKLLDREIDLYISLDAGTPETYAQLRNDTFEKILANLRRLIAAKGGRDGLPRVHLVFMPMKCNVHELDAFVELCADLEVDRLVLRPLNYSDEIALKWDRAGHVFDYPKELLPFEELIRVSSRAAQLCARHNVPLSDQLDFGVAMEEMFGRQSDESAADTEAPTQPVSETTADAGLQTEGLGEEGLPACLEPWTSLYILRRGVLPCCYGAHPIAEMNQHEGAWNSGILQKIRSELAKGKFHVYCLRSPSCPIVRKDSHAGALPRSQAVFLGVRALFLRMDRRLLGVPGKIYRSAKWVSIRVWAALTDPTYLRKHVRRLWNKDSSGGQ